MLKILDRYIARAVLSATILITLIIVGVLFLMTMLGELKSIGSGDYGLIEAIFYVLLRMPNQLYQFSPMLILLGSITGLSMLSTSRELIVMRASGFSIRRIILAVLTIALLIILSISFLGEWLGPGLSSKAEIRKENAQNAGQAVVTAAGVWFHLQNNFIHVQQVVDRQLLEGVTRYQFDDKRHLEAAYYAKTLTFKDKHWMMHDAVKTNFYPDRTKSIELPLAEWDLKFNANLFNIGLVEPGEMSLPKLRKFTHYLEQNGLQSAQYQYDFWQRIFQPLAALVMVFLAIPFVLGNIGMVSSGWRIIAGILLGFTFFILNAILGQISIVYQVPTILAAFLPIVLFAIVGCFLTIGLARR